MDGHPSALAAAADCQGNQVQQRRHQVSRRPHPRSHHQRPHPRRDPPAPLGRRQRHLLAALFIFRSAAATDAVARQGTGAADPRRLPAGGGRGVGQARHLAAGIPIRRALRGAAQSAARKRGGRALPHRSRRRLPRNGRGHDRPRARVGEGRELRQDIWRWRGEVRGDDRQAAARGARDLSTSTTASCRSYPASPTSASARPNGSATPSSTTARAGIGIAGKRRESTPRAPARARARRRSAAPRTPSILGLAAGCAARRPTRR